MPIRPEPSGTFSTPSPAGDYALLFARSWAERLQRQLVASVQATKAFSVTFRQAEYGEEWSPDDRELDRVFRVMWSENATLIWTAHQVEQWSIRLAKEVDEAAPAPIPQLKTLRNVLEHLDEAYFDEDGPLPGDNLKENRSLRTLGSRLWVGSWPPGSPLFGLIAVNSLEALARTLLDQLERQMDELAEDVHVQDRIDEIRGK